MASLAQLSAAELKDSGQREAIPYLIRCLSSEDTPERCIAALGLIQFADRYIDDTREAIPQLIEMARDELHHVRRHALKTLEVLSPILSDEQRESVRLLMDEESRESNRMLIEEILSETIDDAAQNGYPSASEDNRTSKQNRDGLRVGIGHLYATGGNLGRDAIFHVGGVVFTDDAEPQTRDWIINPERPITLRLYKKSQVTNDAAEASPTWRDQKGKIQKFFEGLDVLFVFDLYKEREWFKRHVLGGASRRPVLIDLHEMARYFLPDRTFYDQDELIRQAVLEKDWKKSDPTLPYFFRGLSKLLQEIVSSLTAPISSDDDTPVVLSLLMHALQSSDPIDFDWMRRIAAHENMRWTDEFPPERSLRRIPEDPPPVNHVVDWIKSKLPEPHPETGDDFEALTPQDTGASKTLSDSDIDLAFNHLGKLQAVDHRPEQIEYAKFIGSAINSGGRFAIEAGTGTGKTLGYLVPAAEFLLRHPSRKVIVATATKNLQSQILDRELKNVTTRRSKYQDLRGALFKGKGNYICLSALAKQYRKLFLDKDDRSGADERLAWMHVAILCARSEGDLEAQAVSRRFGKAFSTIRDELNAGEHCTSELCSEGRECIYPRIRAQANAAHFIVTNHHKLATLGTDFSASAAVCIIDEADQFPDNFRNSLEVEVTWKDIVFRFVRRIRTQSANRRGFAELARDHFSEQLQEAPGTLSLERAARACDQIIAACDQITESARLIHQIAPSPNDWEIRWQKLAPEALNSLKQILQNLFDGCASVVDEFERLQELANVDPFLSKRKDQVRRYTRLATDIIEKIQALCLGFDTDECVHVIGPGWTLRRVPMRIGTTLENIILKPVTTTVFTSATLYVNQSLQLFRDELSLEGEFTRDRRISSPFDYPKQVLGFVATSLPRFDAFAERSLRDEWRASIAEGIVQLVEPVYGRSLVLFTNTDEMRAVYQHAKPLLEEGDVEVLIQNGTSLLEIATFRSVEHSALFGVDRFWTGVDFPGPTLSQVIVVRSPNPNLGDPLIEHRRQYIGEQFWGRFYHPIARLKMRQGFGRLMRSKNDRGVFVFLDSRIVDEGPYAAFESEIPVSLEPAFDIGADDVQPSETVQRILAHLQLTREYEVRHSIRQSESRLPHSHS